jgi:hypothetical protein
MRTVTCPTAAVGALLAAFLAAQAPGARGGAPTKEKVEPVKVKGQLQFKSRKPDFDGTELGDETDPRKYIAGDPVSPQRAIWHFDKFPKGLPTAHNDAVPARLTCSIFRLARTAPDEVEVVVRAVSHRCPQEPPNAQQKGEWQWAGPAAAKGRALREQYEEAVAAYKARKLDPGSAKPATDDWKATNDLAETYGYYEVRVRKVRDLVETDFVLPAGLFRNALKTDPEPDGDGKPKRPRVSVYVKCETPGLLLGVMESDLYLVENPPARK